MMVVCAARGGVSERGPVCSLDKACDGKWLVGAGGGLMRGGTGSVVCGLWFESCVCGWCGKGQLMRYGCGAVVLWCCGAVVPVCVGCVLVVCWLCVGRVLVV